MILPAEPLLHDAIDFLAVQGVEILVDWIEGAWRYVESEGEIVAKAIALGMIGHGTVQ